MLEGRPDGATPVDPDEAGDLIPRHIHTRDELNAWEQANILVAAEWIQRTTMSALDEPTIRALHRKMFDRSWSWAGRYRTSDKKLGVYWATVPAEVRKLVADGRFWIDEATYPIDEAALRLHHRLVMIHPFPNGNGRHARLWCDLLLRQNGKEPFRWRAEQLDREGDARQQYIRALRGADAGSFEDLFALFLQDR
jgi:Fic-DOC domain mobile mystery protein B